MEREMKFSILFIIGIISILNIGFSNVVNAQVEGGNPRYKIFEGECWDDKTGNIVDMSYCKKIRRPPADQSELPNCFFVSGGHVSILCIDGLERLIGSNVHVGNQLEATLYQLSALQQSVIYIPLKVTLIDKAYLGNFLMRETIYVEGEDDGLSIFIPFIASRSTSSGMPPYDQRSGSIRSKGGPQIIERYVWERDQNPRPPPECNRPRCH